MTHDLETRSGRIAAFFAAQSTESLKRATPLFGGAWKRRIKTELSSRK